jgi:hypothetical protein
MAPDVQYQVYYAPNVTSITTDNSAWISVPGVRFVLPKQAVSPLIIGGLANGTSYAFTIDGRINDGPAGRSAPSVTATPRLAGASWTGALTPFGSANLNAVTYGSLGGNIYLAVGDGGALASSTNGSTWTALTNPSAAPAANLNAVAFGGTSYVAAGASGTLLYSADGIAWSAATTNPVANTTTLNSLTYGASGYVAVGTDSAGAGVIFRSADGQNWSAASTGAGGNALLAVGYGSGRYVAVGVGGALLTSTDGGVNWTAPTSIPAGLLDLRAVVYGIDASTLTTTTAAIGRFVAAGASGALLTSTDGLTWTAIDNATSGLPLTHINGITYGTQFVLVGDGGAVYTSTSGTSWLAAASGATSNLKAVAHNSYSYSAVGALGANLLAQ